MEAYFPVVTKVRPKSKGSSDGSIRPNLSPGWSEDPLSINSKRKDQSEIISPQSKDPITLSSVDVTKGLLTTLSDVSNPITHSNIYERTVHIVSCSTGHQVSEGRRHHVGYTASRTKKLQAQRDNEKAGTEVGVLKNTRIYIGGYLENSTDIEMKRLIVQAGGEVVHSASNCTHIVTSRGLSGSKTDRILTRKGKNNVYVVKPEWVLDSIAIGKRRSERTYAVVKASNVLEAFMKA
ncbi:DNA repair protein REV1 [Psilocybe cubensis]|uniref:DNA repair protein REV1 n=2 Tax=Psilocybe cubensis TaxID=181762 RepID=A0ACB8H3T1_PSICU|nr:DNA repair protein REV1 [Psilocybe cubensis]KAH9482385.1 DNA repair protein REV1 [Psilocybe cubensis]